MNALDLATGVLFALGALLSITGSVGIVRMPDFYSRLHPAGKTDTAGQFFILGGLVLQAPDWVTGAKLLVVIALLAVSAPTATHAITKAAWLAGLRPWTNRPGGHALDCAGSIPLDPDRPAPTAAMSSTFPQMTPMADEGSLGGPGARSQDVDPAAGPATEPATEPAEPARDEPQGGAP